MTLDINENELIERLRSLAYFLEEEGWYTKANTAFLAMVHIKELRNRLEGVGKRVFS